ncbi:MAG TPA: WD40 repeat domain-containing protein [Bacteroides sp.]|nr:WD40 repeat domain-containing protein [Bacteroides sp.]
MIHPKRFLILSSILACMVSPSKLEAQADEDLLLTFKGHKGPVYSLAVHPDGSTIATGAEDLLIHLWDPVSGEILKTLEGHAKPVKYLCFSNDGRYLLSAGSTDIRIWDLEEGGYKKYVKHVTHVYNVNFNSDASRFLSTSLKPKFIEWDRKERQVINEYELHDRSCLVADYSPDNTKIASGSLDRTIKITDAETGEIIHSISAHGENILSLDFSPNGTLLASASMDKNIKLWNVETGKIHKLLGGHAHAVVYVRFSPDGRYLLSASYDKTAKLWELSTGNCVYTFVDHTDGLYAADFFPDSKKLATCSNDETVKIYKISQRFFAEYYYFTDLQNDMQESGLFEERRKGEKKDEYKQRQEKASKFRKELHEKYYRMHLGGLNN